MRNTLVVVLFCVLLSTTFMGLGTAYAAWPNSPEGFETEFSQSGWTVVSLSGHSGVEVWHTTDAAHSYEGSFVASILYDPNLDPQDVWLISPLAVAAVGMNLSGFSMGSTYWGKPEDQGGRFDYYDLDAYIVRGSQVGDADDTFIGRLDDSWIADWQWAGFSYGLDGLTTPGEMFQIGFRYSGLDGAEACVDYIQLTGALPVPEPASLLALGTGLLGLTGCVLSRRSIR